jgi:hypothetical protein
MGNTRNSRSGEERESAAVRLRKRRDEQGGDVRFGKGRDENAYMADAGTGTISLLW